MAEEKTPEQKAAEESAEEGVQVGRTEDSAEQVEQNPMDDHGGGGDAGSEAIGDGPSGGEPTTNVERGGGVEGAGPSGGA